MRDFENVESRIFRRLEDVDLERMEPWSANLHHFFGGRSTPKKWRYREKHKKPFALGSDCAPRNIDRYIGL